MTRSRQLPGALLMVCVLVVAGCAGVERGAGEHSGEDHILLGVDQVEWQPGPASLEQGAEMAVLEGDPGAPGPVTMRFRLPDGFVIAPHWHPRPERLTVLEGTFHLGMQAHFDPDAAERLPAGSFFVMPPGMNHFAIAEGETVVQLNVQGPWEINYIDPADDPRLRD